MNHTTKASKHFPITNENRHERMRTFLLSQPESEWPRLILAGCALTPHLLATKSDNHSQRPYLLADGVSACLPAAGGHTNAFLEMNPMTAGKAGTRWAEQRLWDRPFTDSKLRQQGSPTIFAGQPTPTISPIFTLHGQDIGVTATSADCPVTPAISHFLRGSHDR